MTPPKAKQLPFRAIVEVLEKEKRVLFAFLYGSMASGGVGNDIDIAAYATADTDPYRLSADLKIELHAATGLSPDLFDVRIINPIVGHGDIFALLYLRRVLDEGKILVDKDPEALAVFLERYGRRYRECEGMMQEILA